MMYAFYFHFNKPATQKRQQVTISVHYRDTCYLVNNVICAVPTKGRIKKTQPRFVMAGKASQFKIQDGVAYIK